MADNGLDDTAHSNLENCMSAVTVADHSELNSSMALPINFSSDNCLNADEVSCSDDMVVQDTDTELYCLDVCF